MPFVTKEILREFGVQELSRGLLYGSGNGEGCTVFHTRMSPAFTGDAVLYLASTPCRYLYFLGTCGLLPGTPGLKIGSLVSPSRCYAQESFTAILTNPAASGIKTTPDLILHRLLQSTGKEIKGVTGISAGSLKLQSDKVDLWRGKGIQVVDLESAAFFAAARSVDRSAAALMAVSDIVGDNPWYQANDRDRVRGSLLSAARILCKIISQKQND